VKTGVQLSKGAVLPHQDGKVVELPDDHQAVQSISTISISGLSAEAARDTTSSRRCLVARVERGLLAVLAAAMWKLRSN
jgi:hypothetical protein